MTPPPVDTPIEFQEEDDYPPPPPPPLNDSDLHMTPVNHRSAPADAMIGHTVIEDHGIHGDVSILSSSRTEDSEDDPKRKNKVLAQKKVQLYFKPVCRFCLSAV